MSALDANTFSDGFMKGFQFVQGLQDSDFQRRRQAYLDERAQQAAAAQQQLQQAHLGLAQRQADISENRWNQQAKWHEDEVNRQIAKDKADAEYRDRELKSRDADRAEARAARRQTLGLESARVKLEQDKADGLKAQNQIASASQLLHTQDLPPEQLNQIADLFEKQGVPVRRLMDPEFQKANGTLNAFMNEGKVPEGGAGAILGAFNKRFEHSLGGKQITGVHLSGDHKNYLFDITQPDGTPMKDFIQVPVGEVQRMTNGPDFIIEAAGLSPTLRANLQKMAPAAYAGAGGDPRRAGLVDTPGRTQVVYSTVMGQNGLPERRPFVLGKSDDGSTVLEPLNEAPAAAAPQPAAPAGGNQKVVEQFRKQFGY